MEFNLQALSGVTYFVPIALTLRKVYAPDFDLPEVFERALAKLDTSKMNPRFVSHFAITPRPQLEALS